MSTSAPLRVGCRSQLLVDTHFIAESRGLTLVVNAPRRAECVLAPEKEWEAYRVFVQQVLAEGGTYRMYYSCIPALRASAGGERPCDHCGRSVPDTTLVCRYCGYCANEGLRDEFLDNWAYATSEDGLHWDRPTLRLKAFRGSRENNLLNGAGIVTVVPSPRGGLRYLAIRGEMGMTLVGSADGLDFTTVASGLTPFVCDTSNQLLWDPNCRRYVAYLRGFPGRRTVVRCEMDDPCVTPWPHREGADLEAIHGETYITDEMPTVMDGKELGLFEVYNPCVNLYPQEEGGIYLAFPTIFRPYPSLPDRPHHRYNQWSNDGSAEIYLLVSRDGKRFTSPAASPYVSLGLEGDYDGGYLHMGVGILEHGEELWQYYTGVRTTHGVVDLERDRGLGGVFRLVQQRDRFAGAQAGPEGGELTTPPLLFEGNRLELNVNCGGLGEAWVELLDCEGKLLPDFTFEEFDTVDLNQLHAPCSWKGRVDLGPLAGKPVRLRIRLRSATLYAFQFRAVGGLGAQWDV